MNRALRQTGIVAGLTMAGSIGDGFPDIVSGAHARQRLLARSPGSPCMIDDPALGPQPSGIATLAS